MEVKITHKSIIASTGQINPPTTPAIKAGIQPRTNPHRNPISPMAYIQVAAKIRTPEIITPK